MKSRIVPVMVALALFGIAAAAFGAQTIHQPFKEIGEGPIGQTGGPISFYGNVDWMGVGPSGSSLCLAGMHACLDSDCSSKLEIRVLVPQDMPKAEALCQILTSAAAAGHVAAIGGYCEYKNDNVHSCVIVQNENLYLYPIAQTASCPATSCPACPACSGGGSSGGGTDEAPPGEEASVGTSQGSSSGSGKP